MLVTIPASETNVSFFVAAVDNHSLDGSRTVEIRNWVKTSPLGARVAEGVPVFVTVNDDDGPALQLSVAKNVLPEGSNPATTATVSRNTGTNASLLVNLASSDINEATVPVSITIPAGAVSATFNIASVDDGIPDGNKSVTVTATATNYASATVAFTVPDVN